eukprot:g19996.t1
MARGDKIRSPWSSGQVAGVICGATGDGNNGGDDGSLFDSDDEQQLEENIRDGDNTPMFSFAAVEDELQSRSAAKTTAPVGGAGDRADDGEGEWWPRFLPPRKNGDVVQPLVELPLDGVLLQLFPALLLGVVGLFVTIAVQVEASRFDGVVGDDGGAVVRPRRSTSGRESSAASESASVSSAQRCGRTGNSSSGGRPARDAAAVQAQPGNTPVAGPGQASGHSRPRNRGGLRRRHSQHERAEPVDDDRASGSIPRPPRPKRAERGTGLRASGSSRSTAARPIAQAVADPVAQTGDGPGAGGRAGGASHSGTGDAFGPGQEGQCALPPSRLEEGDSEEAFPALPPASGGQMLAPMPAVTRPGSLDYSSLAERLAIETAAAAAAAAADVASSSSGAAGSTGGGTISRLSVLPSFGDARRVDAKPRDVDSGEPREPSESQECGDSSPRLVSAEDDTDGRPLGSTLPVQLSSGAKRPRVSQETVALRARLRERWFRLEAARKAQRQRESAERELMAAEDGSSAHGTREHGVAAGSSGAQAQGRSCTAEPAGDADDGGSSDGGRESESGEGNTSRSGSDGASDQGRPKHRRSSSRATAKSGVPSTSETPCVSKEGDSTSPSAAQGVEASSPEPRAVSAAGNAAIRRFEAAAAAASVAAAPAVDNMVSTSPDVASLSRQDLSEQNALGGANVSDESVGSDVAAGASSGHVEKKEVDVAPCEEDRDSGGVPALHGEGVYTACDAGMAGLLNDIPVRSGGRVADGKDKSRRTPLHLAAEAGSLEGVNLLLKQGTLLDQRDKWRETPLHKAARAGNANIVKAFCTARMKVNVRNRHRETPLLLAVRANSLDTVSALLGFGARLDDPDVDGVSPIVEAAMSGQAELLMVMANSNQAWKSSNREDLTDPASKARGNAAGNRRALPRSLYQGSAIRGRGSGRGNGVPTPALSPVHEAAAAGQTETLSLLLQLGVSLEERDSAAGGAGDTPLGRAVRAGQLDCARLLLEAGAMIGRENARGETPLVVAIRAGEASGVELLTQHGAPLEGGRSNGKLTAADGRTPVGAREKMMARRRAEPLELALREGQFACAAVLIEGGARITEGALRSVKLESAEVASREKSNSQGQRVRYAGTSAGKSYHSSTWSGNNAKAAPAPASASLLPLQTDLFQLVSPEVSELADSSPPDGGGLDEDPNDSFEGSQTYYVGGLLSGLGECDIILVLDDGSRLPVHSCLLAAFSGTFRDLFLRRSGPNCEGVCRASCDEGTRYSSGQSVGYLAGLGDAPSLVVDDGVGVNDRSKRSRDVQQLLAGGGRLPSEEADGKRPRQASVATSEAAVAAAALAATSIAESSVRQSPAVVEWNSARGDVLVRFWGAGTMAAVVRHVYTGQSPAEVPLDGLGRLLVASVALRMPRLMRQVEHLLSASLSSQKGSDRSAQLKEVARLLRAARALRATDLEHRCTLYLQANGGFPAAMKLRRELRVPALNAADVTRGLARLTGSGYLGSGPAHAWSSSGVVSPASGHAAVVALAGAKRAVDLSLRKRAVEFDQLVPLLLDPPRCASTLSVGYPERTVLLTAALAAACPGQKEIPPVPNKMPCQGREEQAPPQKRPPVCCGRSSSSSSSGGGQAASPLASNFSAFSHGLGWLLRTGTVADVVLVLPSDGPPTAVLEPEQGAIGSDIEEEHGGEKENDAKDAGVGDASHGGTSGKDRDKDEARQPTAAPLAKDGAANSTAARTRFLAHSMVLAARSEKFAAMLRRDPMPRELELHSPLLSPRSLCVFLEFLYTGVLDPSLSTGDLSELALIADEYLVPDLTRQAEALLMERLELRNAGGCSYSALATGPPAGGSNTTDRSRREEDTASTPLDVLQLGVSLGMPDLSAAAGRAVLRQLDSVSRSEAFEASGMSKRELVVAALEAARS